MDYSQLSDFEINCLVAEATGHKPLNAEQGYQGLQEPGDITAAIVRGPRCIGGLDPCKNPEQAWPIIVNDRIGLNFVNGIWRAQSMMTGWVEFSHENPLRAAMIVFLMMQEQGNA